MEPENREWHREEYGTREESTMQCHTTRKTFIRTSVLKVVLKGIHKDECVEGCVERRS